MGRKVNKRADARRFKVTARKIKKINVAPYVARGGVRL